MNENKELNKTQGDYSFAFKMMVVHEVEKGQITYKQAQAKYGIQGKINCAGMVTQARTTGLDFEYAAFF